MLNCRDEDRDLQHQRHRRAAAAPARMAGARVARRRVPAGAEGAGRELPDRRDPRRGLRRDLARPDVVERRGDPREGRGSGRDPPRPARRSRRHAQPLHRGGGQRHRRRLPVPAERQSAARPEVRLQAQVVRAAASSTRRRCTPRGKPVVLCGDYNVVPTDFDIYNPKCWRKDALLQPESRATLPAAARARLDRRAAQAATRTSASTRSGITSASTGSATRACASTTCC